VFEAGLWLELGINIPSDLDAQVHGQSAVEQYVALLPRYVTSAAVKSGDVIPTEPRHGALISTRWSMRRTAHPGGQLQIGDR